MSKIFLPVDALIPRIRDLLSKHSSLVLSAAPGAGKTTRVPPALLNITDKAVWILEPRRIAAISAAHRIAEENSWSVGQEVGYQVRFDNKSSAQTRLLFLTEALLMRKLLKDPLLRDVGCVVLDEFHERSLHVDLALGALRELQELERPDLKILVMSATLQTKPLSEFLGDAPIVDSPGKLFPLQIRFEEKPMSLKTDNDFIERIRKLLLKAMHEEPGNILCFLPGRGEIERLRKNLEDLAREKNIDLLTLHGQLSLQEQRKALTPGGTQRRIILATNVAESSLTVPGVRIVVDSGLSRTNQLNLRTGLESLDLARISRASATQRAGRAARETDGVAYRAWTQFDDRSLADFDTAEIFRKDLSETLLLLAALGVRQPENFTWFEPPVARTLELAKNFLLSIDALNPDGSLTELGASMREIPLPPRLAKLLLVGRERGIPSFAADLAALLSEGPIKKPFSRGGVENDLLEPWEDFKRNPGRHLRLERVADQLRAAIKAPKTTETHPETGMSDLLLAAYPDRLCRRRRAHGSEAKMVGGRGVKLHDDSSVRTSEFFLALDLTEGREASHALVFQAVGISEDLIQEVIAPRASPVTSLEWDKEKQRFWVIESLEWNGLSVSSEHRRPAAADEIQGRLAEIALMQWDRLLERNQALKNWLDRLQFLNRFDPKYPLLEENQIKEALAAASLGEKSLAGIEEKNLIFYFESQLSPGHQNTLKQQCPESWVVPSGSRIPIRYSTEQGAFVEVRLQELFGLEKAPTVAGQPLTLFLLAPNYRPVQVTRDLQSFWSNGYPEVRKEMRTRYPKHSWPDDPRTAAPQAKGRPRR